MKDPGWVWNTGLMYHLEQEMEELCREFSCHRVASFRT